MAKRRKTAKGKSRSKFRASWRGQLRFGLVSFEVQAVNAHISEKSEVHFHLLHESDHQRIHYAKMCPKHGEVPNDEIVEGYEYAKGKYVEFEKEELDLLRTEQERALSIDAFVDADEIDPIYFDGRMYYLIPSSGSANEPYALLQAAMEKKGRWGVGQVVFSGREQLAVVRPLDGVLCMAMLNYDAEIRKPADIRSEFTRPRTAAAKLKLAEGLIAKWQDGKFNFAAYKDNYRQKVKEAIAAKKRGEEIEAPEEDEPEVINLMEALQRSLASVGKKKGRAKAGGRTTARRTRKRAAKKRA
jgi:DNA end-binding protein Ku